MLSSVFFLRPRFTSMIYKSNNNFSIIQFVSTSRNINNYTRIGVEPLSGSLFVPSEYSVTVFVHSNYHVMELPLEHQSAKLSQRIREQLQSVVLSDEGTVVVPHYWFGMLSFYEKYYVAWKEYILQSKSNNHLSLPLSKILLRTMHEYMSGDIYAPNINHPRIHYCHRIEDGPIAVLDSCRYYSLKKQKVLSFNEDFTCTIPPGSHISSWRQWLIICPDGFEEPLCSSSYPHIPYYGLTSGWCPVNGFERYLPHSDSIMCHLSSPFLDDIKKIMNKDASGLVLRRFAVTSPWSPPWARIIMAIDQSRGYLVYTGDVAFEHQDYWIVLDSTTNYANGDVLYLNKDDNFYVLPDPQSGHVQVWSFQNHILSMTSEITAEVVALNNSNNYHHIRSYLVESLNGNLLLVRRYYLVNIADISLKTDTFEVFKFNFESKYWEVVPSLGNDEAIFVGSNSSFALSSTRWREVIPNCIYFTDQPLIRGDENMMSHGMDNGIFHLKNCTITTLLFTGGAEQCTNLPPTWLWPNDRVWYTQHIQHAWRKSLFREH